MMIHLHTLLQLGRILRDSQYEFVTVTPRTHEMILQRPFSKEASPFREFFGWNRPFPQRLLPEHLVSLLKNTDLLEETPQGVKSRLRVSTLDGMMFFHSAFPTEADDSVFFGPDSYRFVRFLREKAKGFQSVGDLGCGSGVGAIALTQTLPQQNATPHLVFSDINEKALELSEVNALLNGVQNFEILRSDLLSDYTKIPDLLIANPPFMADENERAYRHGGGNYGTALSRRIVEEAVEKLPRGGRLLLYTGSCIVQGRDILRQSLHEILKEPHLHWTYEEIDPDIFGEELARPLYQEVERIAAIGLSLVKN